MRRAAYLGRDEHIVEHHRGKGVERVDEAYAIRRYQQAAALLPLRWQRLCRQVPEEQQAEAEELRLRAGQTLTLLLRGGEVPAARERPYPVVTQTELEQLCDAYLTSFEDALAEPDFVGRFAHRADPCHA